MSYIEENPGLGFKAIQLPVTWIISAILLLEMGLSFCFTSGFCCIYLYMEENNTYLYFFLGQDKVRSE